MRVVQINSGEVIDVEIQRAFVMGMLAQNGGSFAVRFYEYLREVVRMETGCGLADTTDSVIERVLENRATGSDVACMDAALAAARLPRAGLIPTVKE